MSESSWKALTEFSAHMSVWLLCARTRIIGYGHRNESLDDEIPVGASDHIVTMSLINFVTPHEAF